MSFNHKMKEDQNQNQSESEKQIPDSTDEPNKDPLPQKNPFKFTYSKKWVSLEVILFLLVIIAASTYSFYRNTYTEKTSPPQTTPTPKSTQTPTPISTSDWKTYRNDEVTFKFPSTWTEQSNILRGSGFIQKFDDSSGMFTFSFLGIGNYNQATGKTYETIDNYINLPYTVKSLQVDGQDARQASPRAGSENVNSVNFFSKDKKFIYTLELKTGNTTKNTSEADVREGQNIFNQILSTFEFIDTTVFEISLQRKKEFDQENVNIRDYLNKLFKLKVPTGWNTRIFLFYDTNTGLPEDLFEGTYLAIPAGESYSLDNSYEDEFIKVDVRTLPNSESQETHPYLENPNFCTTDDDCKLGKLICGFQPVQSRYRGFGHIFGCGGDIGKDEFGNECLRSITYTGVECLENLCTAYGKNEECIPINNVN